MTDQAFDLSAFLDHATADAAPTTEQSPITASSEATELTNFAFDWLDMAADDKTADTTATATAAAITGTAPEANLDGDLPFFGLSDDALSVTADTSATASRGASRAFTSNDDPFSFFSPSEAIDAPSEHAAAAPVPSQALPVATPPRPRHAPIVGATPTPTPTTTGAMPPPSPLSPATRQKMKRVVRSATAAPAEREARTTALLNEEDEEAEEVEEAPLDGHQDGVVAAQIQKHTTAERVPVPPQSVNEEAGEEANPTDEEAAATVACAPTQTTTHASKMPSSGLTQTRPAPLLSAAASRTMSGSLPVTNAITTAPIRHLVEQSRQRLEQVRQRDSHSRHSTSAAFQSDSSMHAGAATAKALPDATPKRPSTGLDTTDTAFVSACAQLTRQVNQTRAEQLCVSEDVQLKATRVLTLFGPHPGLASLLGPEYAAVPVAQLLPLLVPLFEELLSDD